MLQLSYIASPRGETSMRKLLKPLIIKLFDRAKVFPAAKTDPSEVRALLKTLRPRDPGKPLIRLGPDGDGGYLVPDDLDGISACFSPGVSSVSGFEFDCATRGMDVFLADRSVDQPAEMHPRFSFEKRYVGAFNNEQFMTLDDWIGRAFPTAEGDLILQMDIEGFEYETLLALSPPSLRRFRMIVVEFHNLDQLWTRAFFGIASRCIEKLLDSHYCVHIHPNNAGRSVVSNGIEVPRMAEFTFYRRDRNDCEKFASRLPHPLDFDNSMAFPPLPLSNDWYARR